MMLEYLLGSRSGKALGLMGLVVALLAVMEASSAQQSWVTVLNYPDAVRFRVEQESIVATQVQVFDLAGQVLYRSGWSRGGTIEWPLVTQQGQRVANGVYLYLIRVQEPQGKERQWVGKLVVLDGVLQGSQPAQPVLGKPEGNTLAGATPEAFDATTWTVSDFLGVGTETALADPVADILLEAGKNTTGPTILVHNQGGAGGAQFRMKDDASGADFKFKSTGTGGFKIRDQANGVDVIFVKGDGSGQVGIGTTNPSANARLVVITSATSTTAVHGQSTSGSGVVGVSNSASGVLGSSTNAVGVKGQSDSGPAIEAISIDGVGLVAKSKSGNIMEGWESDLSGGIEILRFVLEKDGDLRIDGSVTSPADFAEMMPVSGEVSAYEPGDVVVIGPDGKITLASTPYATNLAGVYSTKPGFVGDTLIAESGLEARESEAAKNRIPVAILGIVPVKVTAENGPIRPGDLLTTSSLLGHAMKATEPKLGTVLGKALESLEEGTGVIKVLVTLR